MIYFLQAGDGGDIKIGFTDKDDVAIRMRTLQTANGKRLRCLGTMPGNKELEDTLHRRFAAFAVIDGVDNEWFQPVPDLLAIIPSSGLPSCGKVEVVEQHITIKVMTIGRKQMSAKLLDQIPHKAIIPWFEMLDYTADTIQEGTSINDFLSTFDLASCLSGQAWGWIRDSNCYFEDSDGRCRFRKIIWSNGERLFQCKDYDVLQTFDIPILNVPISITGFVDRDHKNYKANDRMDKLVKAIYPLRLKLPGFRDEDQLFYGI